MSDDLASRMAAIEDRQQITDVIHRYCRAMDRGDAALMKAVFWEDGGFGPGTPAAMAKDFIDPMMIGLLARYEMTHHFVSNITIDLQPMLAFTETYGVVRHRTFPIRERNLAVLGVNWLESPGFDSTISHDFTAGVRYCDRFEKRDDCWRIAVRNLIFDWTEVRPTNVLGFGSLNDRTLLGQRGKADISYR